MTKFNEVIIIDWYDNVVKAFCKTSNEIYYCSLIALNCITDEKVYLCIDLKYFKHYEEIIEIINFGNLKDNWGRFYKILNKVKDKNVSYLIKTNDLYNNLFELVKYKDNFNWPNGLIFHDYPEILDKAENLDDWWSYWR